jgi:hypothetical protein
MVLVGSDKGLRAEVRGMYAYSILHPLKLIYCIPQEVARGDL